MARFDRYLLSQFLLLFGFFALVLVSIFWINSAVRLFDQLIADGQSAGIVLQYTLLSLPRVIGMVLPIAGFAAVVYVTNRLAGDSEMVVLRSSGISPWRLARGAVVFGLFVAAAASVIAHLLLPLSKQELAERQRALTRDVTARLLSDGTFLHPTEGVTFYIRQIDPDGTLNDIFLSDRRDPARTEDFTARRAYLVNAAEDQDEGSRPSLVMIDGSVQSLNEETRRLTVTRFDDFSYDLTRMIGDATAPDRSAEYMRTWRLLSDPEGVAAETGESLGAVVEEAHARFRDAGIAFAAALIGFGAMMAGGFSRFGAWRQIGLAVLMLVAVKMSENLCAGVVVEAPSLWPVSYLPVVLGLALAATLLWWAGRVKRLPASAGAAPA
ncbi:LPS export ABC transporter permease LptF [Pseudooceanicola nanhaiensis]|uniref:LPS export ABC transporter permease LptF n=1 Tax=Pseudooceanicola nanhaiensis TaxID=375761 RepID=A0A917SPJ4_9RHOB|nr:LPS export ABC transporter permease LptF [Pseudooceanicola nanhaiensis]GGL89955.1 LPS export ABC transporter permease LptF [Pseudooceanicola nanhaiensis]